MGLLEADVEGYGALRLTDASRAVLRGARPVRLRKDPPRKAKPGRTGRMGTVPAPMVDMDAAAQRLFDTLRQLRTRLAREQSVPPYVIFHDRTLREIALRRPDSPEALSAIDGIGDSKLSRYGAQVLEALRQPVAAEPAPEQASPHARDGAMPGS
jgi:ATP-dependent DNA helicase RecQ